MSEDAMLPSAPASASTLSDGITLGATSGGKIQIIDPFPFMSAGDALVWASKANAGLSPKNGAADYFSQAAGINSLVDTTSTDGKTTAYYNSNLYRASVSDAHGVTMDTPSQLTAKTGMKFSATATRYIRGASFNAGCTATTCYLMDSTRTNTLATATITNGMATFATPYQIQSGTTYYLMVDSAGATYNEYFGSTASYPFNKTNLNYTAYWTGASDSTAYAGNSISIFTSITANAMTIKTVALAALTNAAPSAILVHPVNITLGTSDAISFDLDYTGNLTWQKTGLAVDTWVNISVALSSPMVRLNLTQGAAGENTPTLAGFAVFVR